MITDRAGSSPPEVVRIVNEGATLAEVGARVDRVGALAPTDGLHAVVRRILRTGRDFARVRRAIRFACGKARREKEMGV
jgi:hypothetical protein